MSEQSAERSGREERLDQIIAEYFEAVDGGGAPPQKQFLARHPDFATELEEFFADKQQFDRMAGPFAALVPPVGPVARPAEVQARSSGDSAGHSTLAAGQAPAPPAGTRVRYFGDYELLEEIARGGMGVVYKARQVSLNRVVALKMILAGQVASEADVRRFHTEAEAAANLDHPGIVPIYEVGQHQGQHYFSMGYIEGQSLAAKVAAGPLPAHEAAELAAKVSQAVAYAHQQGVIHRDLKPSNVLLDRDGQPRITDFGLAKRVEADSGLTATGQVLGTPSYMPPEQAAGKLSQVNQTADVYSLGAILYTLLTGRPPFQADNPLDTLAQVLQQEPVSPRLFSPKLSRDLETICLKCLEKEPHRRYAGATELAEDLQRFLGDEPIRARPIGHLERLRRWFGKQRRSVAISAAAAAVTAVVVLGGLLTWYGYRQWRLGHVGFDTTSADSPYLVGEVLDEYDRSVSGQFTVPTQEKMPLPSDSYRLRLSASGRLSEDFQFFVRRDQREQHKLTLDDAQLWPTLQVQRTYELADLEGRADVILLNETGFTRLHGSSCRELWSVDLSADDHPVLRDAPGFRWSWSSGSPSGRGKFDQRPMLVKTVADLDGDGVGDLVFAGRHQAWLLAYSGKEGKFLWVAGRGRAVQREKSRSSRPGVTGTVVGTPAVVDDLDGDGKPDLLATFADVDPQGRRGSQQKPRRWIEAVSGATGQPLWRFDLDERFFQLPSGAEAPYDFRWFTGSGGGTSGSGGSSGVFSRTRRHRYRQGRQQRRTGDSAYVPDAAVVVRSGGKPLAVSVAGTHVVALDLATGKPAWPARDLGFPPARAAQFADLDGDAEPELVLVQQQKSTQAKTKSGAIRLVAWSLDAQKPLWEKKISAEWGLYDLWHCPPPEWPLAADLDGDGHSELIVPHGSSISQAWWRSPPWGGLAVLDGRTGKTRWHHRLVTMDQQVDRFTVGPDIDGDGLREIFVATLSGMDYDLFVDAISGKDGRALWWASRRLGSDAESIGLLRWWHAGGDGWPQLLVSIVSKPSLIGQRGLPGPFVFSAGSGRLTRVGRDMEDVQFADGDGDGLLDLYSFRADAANMSDSGGKLDAVRGLSTEAWRRLGGRWIAGADFNRDGVPDLLSKPRSYWGMGTTTVSGRDGEVLWHASVNGMDTAANSVVIEDDLDRDAVPDVLVYDDTSGSSSSGIASYPLHAISGRTGETLWSADLPTYVTHGALLAESRDLDGDGRPEIVYAGVHDWGHPSNRRSFSSNQADLWLAVLSGPSGKVRWEQRLSKTVGANRGIALNTKYSQVRAAYADLNGDGTLDLLLPADATPQGDRLELRALSGVDGKVLWKRTLAPPINKYRLLEDSPVAVTGDLDGDGKPEVIVLEYFEKEAPNRRDRYHARLLVLDGADGKPKWPPWETKAEPLSRLIGASADAKLRNRPAPLLLTRGQNKPRAIAVGLWGSPGEAVVLEADGRLITRFALSGPKQPRGQRRNTWTGRLWNLDLNGDGSDELLLISDGKVQAIQPGVETPLWQWIAPASPDRAELFVTEEGYSVPAFDAEILDVAPAAEDRPPVVAVRRENAVYGLSATSGRELWSCEEGRYRIGQGWMIPKITLLTGADRREPPRVVSEFPNEVTVCRQAILTGANPPYALARAAPRIADPGDDPRLVRPLAWAGEMDKDNWMDLIPMILWGTLLLAVLIALPGGIVWRMVRRRRWSLRTMLFLPVVVAIVVTVLAADLPLVDRELSSLSGKLSLMMMVLPGVVFAALVIHGAYRKRWHRVLGWLAASGAVAVLLAGIILIGDHVGRPTDLAERYTFDGWYLIWFWGAYATGVVATVVLPGRPVVELIWRQMRRLLAKPKPA